MVSIFLIGLAGAAYFFFADIIRSALTISSGLRDPLDPRRVRDGVNIGAMQIDVTEEGVTSTHELVEEEYRRDAFQEVEDTENTIMFRIDPANVLIIPRRAFQTDIELENFKAFAAGRIGATS